MKFLLQRVLEALQNHSSFRVFRPKGVVFVDGLRNRHVQTNLASPRSINASDQREGAASALTTIDAIIQD
jgi:hypothetical protein